MANILVVDDEPGIRDLLCEILDDNGHSVELAENAAQARAIRLRIRPDLVLLDIWMPDTDGLTLLKEWSVSGLLTMPVIMMSGHATIDTAVLATSIGAVAFLEKPITLQKLLQAVEHGLALNKLRPVPASVQPSPPSPQPTSQTTGTGGPVEDLGLTRTFRFDKPLREGRDEYEKAYFEFHLAQASGSMTRVAEQTGLERTHLYRKLKQLGIDFALGRRT